MQSTELHAELTSRQVLPLSSDRSRPSVVPANNDPLCRGSSATNQVRNAPLGVGSLLQWPALSELWYSPLQALA